MPYDPAHALNWQFGWSLILAGFLSGAVIGLGFHREGFLGGYGAFRRRLLRLGHIALVALGVLNLLFSFSPLPSLDPRAVWLASQALIFGSLTMPLVCFLAAWRAEFRIFFCVPVLSLSLAVILTIYGGMP